MAAPAPAVDREAMFWDSVKGSSDPAELRAYLDTYPTGTFAPIARARVASLEAARQQQVASRATPQIPAAAPPTPAPAAPPQQIAAAPPVTRAGPQFNGLYSANIPLGVISNSAAHAFATITSGNIRISANLADTGPRAGGGNCTGNGPVGDDGAFAEIEIACGRIGDQRKSTLHGKVVVTDKEKYVQAVFTDAQGKATEITFK